MGLSIGLSALGGAMPLLVAVIVLFTIGEMIALPVAHSFIATLAPDDMRGRFMGVLGVAWSGATMIGPAAGLMLFERSPALVWIACCGLGALAAASVAGCRRREAEGAAALSEETA